MPVKLKSLDPFCTVYDWGVNQAVLPVLIARTLAASPAAAMPTGAGLFGMVRAACEIFCVIADAEKGQEVHLP